MSLWDTIGGGYFSPKNYVGGTTMPATGMPAAIGQNAWDTGLFNVGGTAGFLGNTTNLMPKMGGFGPAAQIWGGMGALDSLFRKDVGGNVNTFESMLGNAAQGALAGSYWGAPGAIIGGTIGALGGTK